MVHVLKLHNAGRTPFRGRLYGDMALAALLPKAAPEYLYLYRELRGELIQWWDPFALRSKVEEWLVPAIGNATCVDQLLAFLGVLRPEYQAQLGLPWVAALTLADPGRVAEHSFLLSDWLIETRSSAEAVGLSAGWQEIVDALVVAGVTKLAPYSE